MTRDRVVNTRVSKNLYDKISEKARKNRVSVSNLIRNLVEDAIELHEDFHEAVDKKIRKYLIESEKKNILGFQEILLAKTSSCDNCGKEIKAPEKGYFAFFEGSSDKALLCNECKNHYETTSNN